MQNIKDLLQKSVGQVLDIHFHLERLFTYPENEWFYPKNQNGQDYSVCEVLHNLNIIEQKRTPVWVNGSLRGVKVAFRYSKNLEL